MNSPMASGGGEDGNVDRNQIEYALFYAILLLALAAVLWFVFG